MELYRRTIHTPRLAIAALESAGDGLPVVLIHGNSSCKEVFLRQLESPDAARHRMIALDLPGHGESDDAATDETYSISGYADVVAAALDALGVRRCVIVGWSLGGHVGIELLGRAAAGRGPEIAGLMLVGTPAFGRGVLAVARAFHVSYDLLLATKGRLGPQEARRFGRTCLGSAVEPHFVDMIQRTDARARPALLRSMIRGDGLDQRAVVEAATRPIAVLNGEGEPFARLDFVASLAYGELWDGACHVVAGAGHAPFIEAPDSFNPVLGRFLADLSGRLPGPVRMCRTEVTVRRSA